MIEPVHCGSNSILKVHFLGHPVVWCSWVYIELGRGRHKFLFGRLVGMVICRPKGCNRSVIKIQPRKVQIQNFWVHFSKFTGVSSSKLSRVTFSCPPCAPHWETIISIRFPCIDDLQDMQDNYLRSREIPWRINSHKTRAPQIVESCHPGKQKEWVWKKWRTWRAWKRWKTTTSPLKTLHLWLQHDPGSAQDWRTFRDLWRLEPWVKCSPATKKDAKINL